jgi:hypothetical protein
MKNRGTAKLISIFGVVHMPFRYSISNAKNDKTKELLVVGTGNQNILVKRANIEANIPVRLFLYANMTIGIINRGLIYQLNILWCLSNAQLKKISLVRNNTINIMEATANNIPNIKSVFLFIISSFNYNFYS